MMEKRVFHNRNIIGFKNRFGSALFFIINIKILRHSAIEQYSCVSKETWFPLKLATFNYLLIRNLTNNYLQDTTMYITSLHVNTCKYFCELWCSGIVVSLWWAGFESRLGQ